jgi:uncharacterized protein (TIGR03437 family)
VSPGQLNVQVPWEVAGHSSATVKVILNETYSSEYTLSLATYSPGFFIYTASGQPIAASLDLGNVEITASHPIPRGAIVQFYMNGLGPVNNQPADGWPVSDASSTTTMNPIISIGGQPATVMFSGLAPGYADLYQVNAVVPSNSATGMVPVTCSIGGVSCATVNLFVK